MLKVFINFWFVRGKIEEQGGGWKATVKTYSGHLSRYVFTVSFSPAPCSSICPPTSQKWTHTLNTLYNYNLDTFSQICISFTKNALNFWTNRAEIQIKPVVGVSAVSCLFLEYIGNFGNNLTWRYAIADPGYVYGASWKDAKGLSRRELSENNVNRRLVLAPHTLRYGVVW